MYFDITFYNHICVGLFCCWLFFECCILLFNVSRFSGWGAVHKFTLPFIVAFVHHYFGNPIPHSPPLQLTKIIKHTSGKSSSYVPFLAHQTVAITLFDSSCASSLVQRLSPAQQILLAVVQTTAASLSLFSFSFSLCWNMHVLYC